MLEVDEHRIGRRDLHQPVDRRLRQHDREDAVLHRIARENVGVAGRSEEHTSELQSLMRISYAVFCLKKNKKHLSQTTKQAPKYNESSPHPALQMHTYI